MLKGATICTVALAGTLAACAAGEQREPELPVVVNEIGNESAVPRFDIRAQGRRFVVRVFNRGGTARTVTVSNNTLRSIDRSDGQLAANVAAQAGGRIDCSGQPLRVLAETGRFQEQGRRSAFTGGEAAWIFQAQCG